MQPDTYPPLLDCWYLTGPTGSGKTEVGIELAERLGAEIVSLDSMALYRGMDIGTAKPTPEQRKRVPHHLVDILEPHESFSLAAYAEAAHRAASDIRSRGREVLFVGGTALYLKSLVRGLFVGPPADWTLRNRWQQAARTHPPEWLHNQLAQIDPESARRLHPNDSRRIIRALEVYETTGRRISELQRQFEVAHRAEECRVFVLQWPPGILRRRIDARVDRMFAAGLVAEVQRLLSASLPMGRTARQALGYREVLAHLEQGVPLERTIELVKVHTWQMARRQHTWFRSLSECRPVPLSAGCEPPTVAGQIAAMG